MNKKKPTFLDIVWPKVRFAIGPVFVVLLTGFVYFLSRGYRIDIFDREITKTGVITVKSSPLWAWVTIDDKVKGLSPKIISELKEGTYEILVTKDGYHDWIMDVPIEEETSIPITAYMFKEEPEIEYIFPDDYKPADPNSNSDKTDTVQYPKIEDLFFNQDGSMAVFTVLNETTATFQIWSFPIRTNFWELNPKPTLITEMTLLQENSDQNSKNGERYLFSTKGSSYEISVSPDGQYILLINSTDNRNYIYNLDANKSNQDPTEIHEIEEYDKFSPTWTNDSRSIVFYKDGVLRAYNVESETQTIISESPTDNNDNFIWTSSESGYIYLIENKTEGAHITRIKTNGEDKKIIISKDIELTQTEQMDEDDTDMANPIDQTESTQTEEDDEASDTSAADETVNQQFYLPPIDQITDIRITPESTRIILFTKTQIIIYDINEDEYISADALNPEFLSFSPKLDKFLYLDQSSTKLKEYVYYNENSNPLYDIGPNLLMNLNEEYTYGNFAWHPRGNIIYYVVKESLNKADETGTTGSTQTKITYKLFALHTESMQITGLSEMNQDIQIAVGNSGSNVVGICEEKTLCRTKVH